jgi:EmrB/QacA subfamily drug resistance transporter
MLDDARKRWLALYVLCSGVLMIVLDTTIVNVALPSIREDLEFTETGLVWVVNAYMLTFGGFLLLGGRLGDLFGSRKLFLLGLVFFTIASVGCGLARSQSMLVIARGIQGLGGAVVTAVALALIMNLFTDSRERAKAMGIYGFVCSAGGSIGVLLGGFLTTSFNWHWIFLVNVPIGLLVYLASARLLPKDQVSGATVKLDFAGAITVTASMMLAVYAIVNGQQLGWTSSTTLALLGTATALLIAFLLIETRVRQPLVPLSLFRLRNVATANLVAVLWAAAMFAWFFISALYLQIVQDYNPMQVGLSFLPANVIMAAFSLGLSAKIVMRWGFRGPLAVGLLFAAAGLFWFARAPIAADFVVDVLPGMVLLGIGAGVAFNPMLLAAMSDANADQTGLASGVMNTSFMMGGSLGLAVLASAAAARTRAVFDAGAGASTDHAMYAGYQLAFLLGAVCAVAAAVIAAAFIRTRHAAAGAPQPATH